MKKVLEISEEACIGSKMAASTGIHSSLCRLVFDFKAYDLNSQKMILNSGN